MKRLVLTLVLTFTTAEDAPRVAQLAEYLSRAEAFSCSGGLVVMHAGEIVLESNSAVS